MDAYSVFNVTSGSDFSGDFVAPFADVGANMSGNFTEIYSDTNRQKDQAFYLKGAEYDASDYAGDHLCINVEGNAAGDYHSSPIWIVSPPSLIMMTTASAMTAMPANNAVIHF